MMENIGNTMKARNNEASAFLGKENKEGVIWSGWVDVLEGMNNRAGGREDSIFLSCKDDKFYADGMEIKASEFLRYLGPGINSAYGQKPELKTILAKALLAENDKDKLN